MEPEPAVLAVEDRHADDVRGQQVAGELNALELQPEGARDGVRQGGLAHPGKVLDQQMAAGEHAGQREPDLAVLAEDDAADLFAGRVHRLRSGFDRGFEAESAALRRLEVAQSTLGLEQSLRKAVPVHLVCPLASWCWDSGAAPARSR